MLSIHAHSESWPINGSFNISRGSKTTADVIVVEIYEQGSLMGRGEGVPYPRYEESIDTCLKSIKDISASLEKDPNRHSLLERMEAGSARNALDCALWDYESKKLGKPVWELAGLKPPKPPLTAYTISVDHPDAMSESVKRQQGMELFKLKLKGLDDLRRVQAVREASPSARIIVDANEAWEETQLPELLPKLRLLGVELVEQPLPAGKDEFLSSLSKAVPLCADESCHTIKDIDKCLHKYEYINIKLDKAGGLTHALTMMNDAMNKQLGIMLGCMVCTSLSIAPALLLANMAQIVDLDGPLLLAKDRQGGIQQQGSLITGPETNFWGNPN